MANSYVLKVNRSCELPEALEIGTEYQVKITGEVTGVSKDDNDDGSYTYTHKLGLKNVELVNNKGKVIKMKDTRKQSVKLRGQINALGEDYDKTMTAIRHFLPEILTLIKKLE